MSGISGTPRKFLLDGESFDLVSDSDFTKIPSKYEKEALLTSGDPIIKFKKRTQNIEGEVACNSKKLQSLKEKAESQADITISVTYADGSVDKGKGHISLDTYSAQDGKVKMTLIPSGDGWTFFEA